MYLLIEDKQYEVNPIVYRESINKVLFDNFMQVIINGADIQTGENVDILIVLEDKVEMKFNMLVKEKQMNKKTKFKTVNSRQVLVSPAIGVPILIGGVSFKTPNGWFLASKEVFGLLKPESSDLKELKEYKGEGKYCFNSTEVVIFNEPLNVSFGDTISITNVDSLTDLEKTVTIDPWTSMLDISTGVIYNGLEVKKFLMLLSESSKEREVPVHKQEDLNIKEVLTLANLSGPDGNLVVKNFDSKNISYLPHNTADYRITVIGEDQFGDPVNFTFSANDRVSLIKPGTGFIINNPSEAIEYLVSNYPQAHSTVSGSSETTDMSKVEKVVMMFNTLTGKNLTAADICTITDLILLVDKEG